jgi:pyroglutamyl-peptidase
MGSDCGWRRGRRATKVHPVPATLIDIRLAHFTMPHTRILLTGFEPFDGASSNPSWQLAQSFDGHEIAGARIRAVQLPCVFGQALAALELAVRSQRPQIVLALGLAAGRAEMSVERVAINVDDARIPDNAGYSPIDQAVVAGGPAAYFSTLPIKTMVQQMQAAGVPATVSQTAGTFVCNHVFYGLMHLMRRRRLARAGFMHVPLLRGEEECDAPALDWGSQRRGVEVALQAALLTKNDIAVGAGAIC